MRTFLMFLFLVKSAFAADFYSISETSIDGNPVKMSDYKNKVILVVNLASQCGYTPQIEKLEELNKRYAAKAKTESKANDFVILGVPTNDFGGQTPEDDKGFQSFCSKNYSVTFPLLTKKTVTGPKKRELYKFLTEQNAKDLKGEVSWNFEKFLVNKKGEVVGRYKSSIDPLDKELTAKIDSLLK